ncbi:hypothetical protein SPRG_17200 [Saprolegnia parasitica CBS 223.65]|uniref:Uncharacterized protein n=1 Tax=Saprolegnia parasitica (strain CBS 223.65) TaxID=695850 RepID=A0A067BKX3_SAPPC|nr:hypothetical protein SPRG_17200 [Saprolegnia parasitica CBS 223.65]KDO17370.1 hypothetical protein SPRG_17200 [Saprolegnia parasitica CBS 223.65]|eukprot:XP_012211922.1 hypothetical protein SPRG_17200 [Saprolegnia parasitica CBS 223.65]
MVAGFKAERAFEAISFEHLRRHWTTSSEPFVAISGVSVDLFSAYCEDDEDAPVALRFVDLVDGDTYITGYASSTHEAVIDRFKSAFLRATGDGDEVATRGSFTASRGRGIKKKQADATFGPLRQPPNRVEPPPVDEGPQRVLLDVGDWVTLAVEVGHYETWNGLEVAGNWWSHYVGVKYVLLMQVNAAATQLAYQLYEISQVGSLPPASRRGSMTLDNIADAKCPTLRFDTRVLLVIPPGEPLPANMNDYCYVNLLRVLEIARRILYQPAQRLVYER